MSILDTLRKTLIFKTLDESELQTIASRLQTREVKAGQVLFKLGDPGDEMIVVQGGQVAIYMPEEGRPEAGQALRIFQAGDMFGEMALIDHKPRSASARTETDCTLACLHLNDFTHMLEIHPDVGMSMMAGLNQRIRYTTDFIGEIRQWVKRVGEGNYDSIEAKEVDDTSLAALAADFVRMAATVKAREEKLQREVAQLRIEIDEAKRKQDVQQITESDYYLDIKAKLRAMREADDD